MTSQQHPITPPPALVEQWLEQSFTSRELAAKAFQAGADQELEWCINYFLEYDTSWSEDSELITGLRAARRPKPPSLKEQALEMLECIPTHDSGGRPNGIDVSIIRRALEQLDD